MGIKKKKNIHANCRSWMLSHFSKISNDCKNNVFAHQSCIIEQSFGWKRNYRHTSYLGLPAYCNTWKCFKYSFEAEKQGEFVFFIKFLFF